MAPKKNTPKAKAAEKKAAVPEKKEEPAPKKAAAAKKKEEEPPAKKAKPEEAKEPEQPKAEEAKDEPMAEAAKEEEEKERAVVWRQGKGAKGRGAPTKGGKGRGPVPVGTKQQPIDDDVEVDYIAPDVLEGSGMENAMGFAAVRERFKHVEPPPKEEENEEAAAPKKRAKPKASLLEEAEDSEDEDEPGQGKVSKKRRKLTGRMSVAELKTLVRRPDVVEVWDTTSADPRLLVYLKAYRNTVTVPRHWSSKRKYMAGKRGVEKPPFKLPEFIEATGIAKIRQAIIEKQDQMSLKQKSRARVHPKMGKLDIDYQVLHDAFFKFSNKQKLTKHNELYHEGKEYEAKMMTKRPGQHSAALKEALGMSDGAPPPWLINMQRYGPPPAYPNLKIPGLNAPIPQGAEYGYHPGGWGKPPVDEFGNPLYGDWRQTDAAAPPPQPEDLTLWGEVDEDFDDDDDEDEAQQERQDGVSTPMLGTSTPLVGSGSATPVVSMEGGVHSISGVSSITSGMDTPGTGSGRSKRGGIASVSGVSSASLTPTPQLFQVLEEQKARSSKGLHPSSHTYKIRSKGGGGSTPIAGVGSSGTGTPLAGIGTPVGGIGTPHGISTPHGIGTPGMGTPGIGTRTPHGIGTPISAHGVGSAGVGTGTHTPHGVGTHTPGIGTPMGGIGTPHVGGIATPVGGIATPVGGIATPVGGIATPVGGIATPVGGIATPVGGIATPMGGIATPVGGVATPTGIPGAMVPTPVGGADTPGPVTMSLNPQDVETEGILTADIIRQQLKQHEEAAAKAKLAAGQKEVEPRKGPVKEKKRKDKTKFKF
mmetsp:Transcript_110164/g.311477  ORF Transcript_110164/g.311477 Transcript_110164/m.311477 type:complete len:815 (-) Transcript_110164:145-2589(-)